MGVRLGSVSRLTRILSLLGRVLLGQGTADPIKPLARTAQPRRWAGVAPRSGAYIGALAQAVVTTVVAELLFTNVSHVERADIILLYILGIMVVAARCGRGPATVSAVLSVAAFDLFYIPPYLTFAVSNSRYILTFTVMLIVGLVISALTEQIRLQAEAARLREARTAALYALSRELTQLRDTPSIAACAARHIGEMLDGQALILLPDAAGGLAPVSHSHSERFVEPRELPAANWAFDHHGPAGRGTEHFPESTATYLPLTAADRTVGVLGIIPMLANRLHDPDSRALLDALCRQTAIALQHVLLAQEAQASELRARSEELRSSLLSSVSHDLRTPLAAVTGAASTLLTQGDALAATTRRDLLQAIYEEATRLGRLVANLLDMTRLHSGTLVLRQEWTPIEEPIGAVLGYLEAQLGARELRVAITSGLPLLLLDAVLVEQLLVNLLENAIKYGGGGPIEIRADLDGDDVVLEVADHGPGIPIGHEDRIFEKFYRAAQGGATGGVGLGLAICRAVATAHGAHIAAGHRPGGGAVFRVIFPRRGAPPPLPDDEATLMQESVT